MTKYKEWAIDDSIDVLIGGTPCQSFSVAGLRKGLDDPRGNLMLTYLAIAEKFSPTWLVWENVPGVLSSNGGRDFGAFLGALGELGYGFAYRVLDAQYFGVAQRRRRVFVVGCAGGQWQRAAAVLFERESMSGNPAPCREKRQDVAATVRRCIEGLRGDGCDDSVAASGLANVAPNSGRESYKPGKCASGQELDWCIPVAAPILARQGKGAFTDPVNDNVIATPFTNRGVPTGDVGETLRAGCHGALPMVAIPLDLRNALRDPEKLDDVNRQGCGVGEPGDPADTLSTGAVHGVCCSGVRRLTPRECERLQGFPDDYTLIPYRNKPAADGPRYRALGNSMAVPVIRWIGRRIEEVAV